MTKRLPLMPIILVCLITGYALQFSSLKPNTHRVYQNISSPLPSPMLRAASFGYLNQIFAEALFIKAAIYYGGRKTGSITNANLTALGDNYLVMSQLHPKLIDIYYLAEAVLAWEGAEHASKANRILENGRKALPDSVLLPFFEGFNYFRFLNNNTKAAEALYQASEIPGAPSWLRHLAAVLQAEGGNIRAGLVWLQGMLATTNDDDVRQHYEKEIHIYEQALRVQSALENYYRQTGSHAASLQALLPDFLQGVPDLGENYELEYDGQKLQLRTRQK